MNVLIISNYIRGDRSKYQPVNVDIESWHHVHIRHSFCDYQIICIDLTFDDYTDFNHIKHKYIEIYNNIKSEDIKQGRNFIFICGYQNKEIFTYDDEEQGLEYEPMETFDIVFKANRNLRDITDVMHKGKYISKPLVKSFINYFELVDSYFISISGNISNNNIKIYCKSAGSVSSVIAFEQEIEKGIVAILPGYKTDKPDLALDALIDLSTEIANKTPTKTEAFLLEYAPDWVPKYISNKHKKLPQIIELARAEKQYMDRICHMLYGKDIDLEFSVKFALEYFGMTVEKTGSKESYDLFVTYTLDGATHEICVEVTGSINVFDMSNSGRKLAQLQDIIVNKKARRGWLLINPYCNDDLSNRINKPLITEKIKAALLSIIEIYEFDLSIITTTDLFFIWQSVVEKKLKKTDALKILNSMHGMSELDIKYLPQELQTTRRK